MSGPPVNEPIDRATANLARTACGQLNDGIDGVAPDRSNARPPTAHFGAARSWNIRQSHMRRYIVRSACTAPLLLFGIAGCVTLAPVHTDQYDLHVAVDPGGHRLAAEVVIDCRLAGCCRIRKILSTC